MNYFEYHWLENEETYCIFDDDGNPIIESLEFLESEKRRGLSQNDQENKAIALMHWFEFLEQEEGGIHFANAKTKHIPLFINWLKTNPEYQDMYKKILRQDQFLKSSSVMQYISRVSIFYDRYVYLHYANCTIVWKEELSNFNHKNKKKIQHKFKEKVVNFHPDANAIPPEHFKKIRAQAKNLRDSLIFDLVYISGLRRGELASIDKEQFDVVDRTLPSFKMILHDSFEIRADNQTKTGSRKIYIPSSLAERIGGYITHHRCENKNKHQQIFTAIANRRNTKIGDPLTGKYISKLFKNAAVAAGYPQYSIHSCRHSMITNSLSLGVDIKTVMDQSGHKSLKTLMGYRSKHTEPNQNIDEYCAFMESIIKD